MLPRQPKHHQEADLALREFQQGLTVGKVVLDVGDKAAIAKVQRNQLSNLVWLDGVLQQSPVINLHFVRAKN